MIGAGIKRGTAELAVLSVLGDGALHGYEMARRIEQQTRGALRFTLASLYPLLYRMEKRGWVRGAWETSPTGRRRRCYNLTPQGMGRAFSGAAASRGVAPCVTGKSLCAANCPSSILNPTNAPT